MKLSEIEIKPLSPSLWNDFVSYFEFDGKCSGCWCMNHRLPMGLDFEGEAAKLAMKQLVETERVFGVLAYVDGDKIPVGWASLDRRKTLPGHDCIGDEIACEDSIWSIHCVTSRKDYKNQGVEEALIKAAESLAKDKGATRVEGYPEPGSSREAGFKTWNTFSGFTNEFTKNGFSQKESVSEFYSVVSKDI